MAELAVVMQLPDGRFVHRRVLCSGRGGLVTAIPHLCDPDSVALAHAGSPSAPRHVRDDYFTSADDALVAAARQYPVADPDNWLSPEALFEATIETEMEPEAERLGRVASLALAGTFLAVFLPLTYFIKLLLMRFPGLRNDESDSGEDLLLMVAFLVALTGAFIVGALISKRKLTRERSRDPEMWLSSLRSGSVLPVERPDAVRLPHNGQSEMPSPRWIPLQTIGLVVLALAALLQLGDLTSQLRARDLLSHGIPAVAEQIRVKVAGAASWETFPSPAVREVEVKLAGVAGGGWLPLSGVTSPELRAKDEGTSWVGGWQTPTDATSYTAPLSVLYSAEPRDVHAVVMQADDASYWAGDIDYSMTFQAAGLGALLIALSFARQAAGIIQQRRLA